MDNNFDKDLLYFSFYIVNRVSLIFGLFAEQNKLFYKHLIVHFSNNYK